MYDAFCCKGQTSTLKDALTLVSINLHLFHIHQTFRVSPWLKVNGKLRDYHLALTSHLDGVLHLLSLDRNYSKSRNLSSTRRVKSQYLHFTGICRTGRMYINIGMSTVLGTRVRSVPPCSWVKVSLVEETTKYHQKVKH